MAYTEGFESEYERRFEDVSMADAYDIQMMRERRESGDWTKEDEKAYAAIIKAADLE